MRACACATTVALSVSLLSHACAADEAPTTEPAWPVAGRAGITRYLIVPTALAREREAYLRQIAQLCEPTAPCFLNFYTNSSGAALQWPLPDAIEREPTAVFRRSTKQGAEMLRWSCRLQLPEPDCF